MDVLVIVNKDGVALVLETLQTQTQTGRFQLIDHKCCFYATLFSHNCRNALVAFAFLGYNIYLNGENMIKPGTLCMIRGVPSDRLGNEFNGNVVVVGEVKRVANELIYWIQPQLVDRRGLSFNGCRHQWLRPFDDFGPETLTTTNKELETQ
jgi:hypothetical protein